MEVQKNNEIENTEHNEKIYVDANNESVKAMNEANPRDIEFYLFTKEKLMVMYHLFKSNRGMFRTFNCCDKCYTIFGAKKVYFRCLNRKDLNICDECFIKLPNEYKCNYKEVEPVRDEKSGIYENIYCE